MKQKIIEIINQTINELGKRKELAKLDADLVNVVACQTAIEALRKVLVRIQDEV